MIPKEDTGRIDNKRFNPIMQEDIRYIENPFKKIVNIIKPDHDKLYSLLFELIQEFIQGSELPTLSAVASDPSQTENDISVYAGANGYLYTLIRLCQYLQLLAQVLFIQATTGGEN